MALHIEDVPCIKKEITMHPWEKIIKTDLAPAIKYAHNSIHNPKYPRGKQKPFEHERVKFTIVGNRVTKEFIYCVNLTKEMHMHKRNTFEAPAIRGVTGVEWPKVWNDLKIKYGGLAYCLRSQVAVLMNDDFLGSEQDLKELIETRYTFHNCPDYYKEAIAQFSDFVDKSGRPCVYMHFMINYEHCGTMIFMLYADLVPRTCENFIRLCRETKGGYAGTPVHRIVKDGWIQCGGFGLKDSSLSCENFIVPHDRRGVLCMANDGIHVDCSTQFFVLLQPAQWMAKKYVAFGQLIDGDATLTKIENVLTYYEAPTSDILIYRAGLLNLHCQDIVINKGTNEYIQGHIEDLVALEKLLHQELLEKVFERIEKQELEHPQEEDDAASMEEDNLRNIHATRRFIRNKEDMKKQLAKSDIETGKHAPSLISQETNDEFDVEVYETEAGFKNDLLYEHLSVENSISTSMKEVEEEKYFYIPLTDVIYPGEIHSTYDLKKFFKGDYCLELDLEKKELKPKKLSVYSEFINFNEVSQESSSVCSLDSEEEREIRRYIKMNVDRVSFAGGVIKNIAAGRGKHNIFEEARKSEMITDEDLRRFRLLSVDFRSKEGEGKKVTLSIPHVQNKIPKKIKRRQTGFVGSDGVERVRTLIKESSILLTEESSATRKVRIDPNTSEDLQCRFPHGQLCIGRLNGDSDSDTKIRRHSVLTRLYDDVKNYDEPGQTLKDYKPISEMKTKNILLTYSTHFADKSEESTRNGFNQPSQADDTISIDRVLNLQHGKKAARKVSSDYVKTIDQIEQHKAEKSIRSIEFAKKRPSLSVKQYHLKNQAFRENQKKANEI